MASPNNGHLTLDEIRHGIAGALSFLKAWAISDQQMLSMLGARSMDELKRWVTGEARSYPGDLPHRLGLIYGIHGRLRQIHADPRQSLAWLSTPSETFENKRPIDVMAGGHVIGLMMVRDQLKELEQQLNPLGARRVRPGEGGGARPEPRRSQPPADERRQGGEPRQEPRRPDARKAPPAEPKLLRPEPAQPDTLGALGLDALGLGGARPGADRPAAGKSDSPGQRSRDPDGRRRS